MYQSDPGQHQNPHTSKHDIMEGQHQNSHVSTRNVIEGLVKTDFQSDPGQQHNPHASTQCHGVMEGLVSRNRPPAVTAPQP